MHSTCNLSFPRVSQITNTENLQQNKRNQQNSHPIF